MFAPKVSKTCEKTAYSTIFRGPQKCENASCCKNNNNNNISNNNNSSSKKKKKNNKKNKKNKKNNKNKKNKKNKHKNATKMRQKCDKGICGKMVTS